MRLRLVSGVRWADYTTGVWSLGGEVLAG